MTGSARSLTIPLQSVLFTHSFSDRAKKGIVAVKLKSSDNKHVWNVFVPSENIKNPSERQYGSLEVFSLGEKEVEEEIDLSDAIVGDKVISIQTRRDKRKNEDCVHSGIDTDGGYEVYDSDIPYTEQELRENALVGSDIVSDIQDMDNYLLFEVLSPDESYEVIG